MKNRIRNKILKRREEMSENEVLQLSKLIIENFKSQFLSYKSYLLYYSFDNEVKTDDLLHFLYEEGKSVYLPILSDENG
jgi:5-formyltetrahydrofolate cyclo-ligase